jgi:hypothetical protein
MEKLRKHLSPNKGYKLRMPSSGTLHRVALVRTYISEERVASVVMAKKKISELGATLAVTSNRSSVLQLLVTANVAPSLLSVVT